MLKLKFNKSCFGLGTWGEWSYGKDHGTFGKSAKGMWAQLYGCIYLGIETYEQDVTESFKKSLIKWRKMNHRFKKFMEAQ